MVVRRRVGVTTTFAQFSPLFGPALCLCRQSGCVCAAASAAAQVNDGKMSFFIELLDCGCHRARASMPTYSSRRWMEAHNSSSVEEMMLQRNDFNSRQEHVTQQYSAHRLNRLFSCFALGTRR